METTNEYEKRARERKATALIDTAMTAYDGEGFSVEDLENFTDAQWDLLADCAGVRPPSEVTRALTISSLKVRLGRSHTADEVFAKLAKGSMMDDPFVGL